MKYSKPHLPYEDQLDLLIRRGLACSDRAGTLYWLKRIGYYRLSAYFIPFKDATTGNFRPGTTFEQIIDLYRFDADLRRLVREALDRIEISVRAVINLRNRKRPGRFRLFGSRQFCGGIQSCRLHEDSPARRGEIDRGFYRPLPDQVHIRNGIACMDGNGANKFRRVIEDV